MDAWRLVGSRARARRGLLTLAAVVIGLTAAASAAGSGYAAVATAEGLATILTEVAPRDGALHVRTRLAPDPAAQESAADGVLDASLTDLPVVVHRTQRSVTLPLRSPDGRSGEVVLGADAGLTRHARVIAGEWPAEGAVHADVRGGAVPGAVSAHAADRLGLAPGDTVTVGDEDPRDVVVVAVWEAHDPDDARWFGDPLVASHGDRPDSPDDAAEPLALVVVGADALAALDEMVLTRWTLVPDPDAISPADLPAVGAALAGVGAALKDADGVAVQGMAVEGGLVGTLARTDASLTAVRGVTTALVLAVVLVAVVALSQVARLLADVRARETTVLRSRGTSLPQLAGAAAVEGAVVTLPAVATGILLAALVLRTVGAPPLAPLAWSAALTAVGATAVLTTTAVGRAVTEAREPARSGRTATLGAGAVSVVAAAAGLACWQLTRYGSPTFVGVSGTAHVDPLAALALPLVLLTVALLSVALLGPTASLAARRAERHPGLVRVLTRRQLARRTPVHAVTAALVALTVATGTFVAVQAGTWQQARDAAAALRTGADVRVALPPGTATEDVVAAYRELTGVEHAAAVRSATVGIGRETGRLVAAPRAALEDVVLGDVDIPADLHTADGPSAGTALPLVLSSEWAADLAVGVGDAVRVRVLGLELAGLVVGTVPVVPGATGASPAGDVDRAALADLDVIDALLATEGGTAPPGDVPAPGEVWLATGTADRAAVAAVAATLPTTTAVTTATTPADPLSAPTVAVAWLVATCALLLAVPGVASALVALAHSRREEVALLRALGVGAAQQARARGVELARVAAGGAAVGIVGGAAAGWVIAPAFVRSTAPGTTPGALPVPPQVSVLGLLVMAVAVGAALVLVGLAHGAHVGRQAASATVRDDVR